MSESITFGSVHQKRSARAQPLRHARASCRESRFQAEKEIGGPTQPLYQFALVQMILPFDSVRFAKLAFGNRQTLKIREVRPPSKWGEAISNSARIHQIPSFVIADQDRVEGYRTGQG
jgi:hypothetical protein